MIGPQSFLTLSCKFWFWSTICSYSPPNSSISSLIPRMLVHQKMNLLYTIFFSHADLKVWFVMINSSGNGTSGRSQVERSSQRPVVSPFNTSSDCIKQTWSNRQQEDTKWWDMVRPCEAEHGRTWISRANPNQNQPKFDIPSGNLT